MWSLGDVATSMTFLLERVEGTSTPLSCRIVAQQKGASSNRYISRVNTDFPYAPVTASTSQQQKSLTGKLGIISYIWYKLLMSIFIEVFLNGWLYMVKCQHFSILYFLLYFLIISFWTFLFFFIWPTFTRIFYIDDNYFYNHFRSYFK